MTAGRPTEIDKSAARHLIDELLARAGMRQRDLAAALFLAPGTLARKLGPRYPDRFTEVEIARLATVLELSADHTDLLRRGYGYTHVGAPGRAPLRRQPQPPTAPNPQPLPAPLTSFIGRGWERSAVVRLLATTRLLTLTGAGGCGKTRLALAVAGDLHPRYAGGVLLVELGAVPPGLALPTIAAAAGVREAAERPLIDALADRLHAEQPLLLLDNCEHVIEECAHIVESLLRACPSLTLLTTSREPLRIPGETVWRVPPLSVPSSEPRSSAGPRPEPETRNAKLDPDQSDGDLLHYESVRLFCDRAATVAPGFTITDQNAAAIAQVCRRLDGIPLAIELAAARIAVLSPGQIADRLDDTIGFLTQGSRTAQPRQQTLRGALDWSHDLLSPAEQALFRRLAAFARGFSLDAVEAVGADLSPNPSPTRGGVPRHGSAAKTKAPPSLVGKGVGGLGLPLLDLLTALVAKSLVLAEQRDGLTRYRLLEPIRQYARDQLQRSGEADLVYRAHHDWVLALAIRTAPRLIGAERDPWFRQIELEQENIRVVLEWTLTQPDGAEAALRISGALWRFWQERGQFSEGRSWLDRALNHAGEAPAAARAVALNGAGILAREQGDYARAAALFEESLPLSRALDDRRGVAASLNSLGMVARDLGQYDRAWALYEESLGLRRALNDDQSVAATLNNLGLLAGDLGRYEQAMALHEASLATKRRLGDRRGVAASLNNLGMIALARHDWPGADALFSESLAQFRALSDTWAVGVLLHNLGRVTRAQGDLERARALYVESLSLRWQIGDKPGIAWCIEGLGAVARRRGRLERAAQLFGAAAGLRTTIGAALPPHERAEWEQEVAAVRAGLGEAAHAAAWSAGRMMPIAEAVALASG